MADILCKWLNEDLKISKRIDSATFAKEFSTGYYLGEVLQKYQLQDDFDTFSQSENADAKLNNFMRLEPTFKLLGVPFDTNIARDIMSQRHGIATRLLYQLFIALENKRKANLTGCAMETMRPQAPVKLESIERPLYTERLKMLTPRQTDLNIDALVDRFREKKKHLEEQSFKSRFEEEDQIRQWQQNKRQQALERSRKQQQERGEMLAKLQASVDEIPARVSNKTLKAISLRKKQAKKHESEDVRRNIEDFENSLKASRPPVTDTRKQLDDNLMTYIEQEKTADMQREKTELIKPASNDVYINKIRKRLHEDSAARLEREKRRRKVLVDQLKAHQAQEEARREEMMVNRLMRQSQQERRIAVQLLQARHEKAIICQNRLFREKQYQDRREKDFIDAMNREKEMALLAKQDYMEQTRKDKELHDHIMSERAAAKYRDHYNACMAIMLQLVDFSCKMGEYIQLTDNLVPSKLHREWKELFVGGLALYEEELKDEEVDEIDEQMEEDKRKLLDEGDMVEYRNMMGEWDPSEGTNITVPVKPNVILGHITHRLFGLVAPPPEPAPPPEFPAFPIRAAVLGKVFSGKSSCLKRFSQEHNVDVLVLEDLVQDAIEAHKSGEVLEIIVPPAIEIVRETPLETPPTPEGEQLPVDEAKEAEKTDPEQLEEPTIEMTETLEEQMKLVPTTRASLGERAYKCLCKGLSIEDESLVGIIVEGIRRVEEGKGWVLDGFPSTVNQAKLLEKALSGYEPPVEEPKTVSISAKTTKKPTLVPDPHPVTPPPPPASGLDAVIFMCIEDDIVLKRSAGRYYAAQSNVQYHNEFKPPPEGSCTGVLNQEVVLPVQDQHHDKDQVQHRITTFVDNIPEVEAWYNTFGILACVDANKEQDCVYVNIESVLLDTIAKVEARNKPPEPIPEVVMEPLVDDGAGQTEVPPAETVDTVETQPPTISEGSVSEKSDTSGKDKKKSGKASPKTKRKGSASPKRSGSADKKKSADGKKSASKERAGSAGKRGRSAEKGAGKDRKRSGSSKGGKGKKSPEPEPPVEVEPQVPQEPPPPVPGSEDWVYVDKSLDIEIAGVLASQWENVEETYINGCKHVFRNIRQEKETIIRYIYQIKVDFKAYLRRPDHKQEFVDQWQKEYNEISEDMRQDEEVRAELHQRVNDLRDILWDICDTRKEEAEKERMAVINEGWVEDHLGILTNHLISLMQTEVEKFQDTLRMLKDYYIGMDGKMPDEVGDELPKVPLLDIPPVDVAVNTSTSQADSASSTRSSAKVKKADDDLGATEPTAEEQKPKIPLIPRRPGSTDFLLPGTSQKKDAKKAPPAKKPAEGDKSESPPPPQDPDERILWDAHSFLAMCVQNIIQAEQSARDAEEEAERQRLAEIEKAAAAQPKGGGKKDAGAKKGKGSAKKGGKSTPAPDPTPTPSEDENEEVKKQTEMKEKMKEEYFGALMDEDAQLKIRLDQIRFHGFSILQMLKQKSETGYVDMNDWLGVRFQAEMNAIDNLFNISKQAIESHSKIQTQIVLMQDEMLLFDDLKTFHSPEPPARPPPVEIAGPDQFTIAQLKNLLDQFQTTAPSGMISSKAFIDILLDMNTLTHGMELLPDVWMNLSFSQIQDISAQLAVDTEYVDWRKFLVTISQPWPIPTQEQLLEVNEAFMDCDLTGTDHITTEDYFNMRLWFETDSRPPSPLSPSAPYPFDRQENLKLFFFELFANFQYNPPIVNYQKMLFYFCDDTDANRGFHRALSVACGTNIQPMITDDGAMSCIDTMRTGRETISREQTTVTDPESEGGVVFDESQTLDEFSGLEAMVPIEALVKVLQHNHNLSGDSHRFSVTSDPENSFSVTRLAAVYNELGADEGEPLLYTTLASHPVIQDCITECFSFKLPDLQSIIQLETTLTTAE